MNQQNECHPDVAQITPNPATHQTQPVPTGVAPSLSSRGGCAKSIASGCGWMVLGALLTIMVQVAGCVAMVGKVNETIFSPSGSGSISGSDEAGSSSPDPGTGVEEFYGRKRDREEEEQRRKQWQKEAFPEQPDLEN